MKNKITKLAFALFLISGLTYAQEQRISNEGMPDYIRKATDIEFLEQFSKEKAIEFEKNFNKAIEIAKAKGMPLNGEEEGRFFSLIGYDEETELLRYYTTFNNVSNGSSLQTANAKPLHADGIIGTGMKVGIWDGGVLVSHQAFPSGRYVTKDNGNSHPLINAGGRAHAVHVAGTVAGGVFGDGTATGFAYGAQVFGYNWYDDLAEMASAAANQINPIYTSNHSYGLDFEKYSGQGGNAGIFGRYDASSREYDLIANKAPYYTIVFAAGNDRTKNYNPSRSGKDLLSEAGVSKNVVVVAATLGTEDFSEITGAGSVVSPVGSGKKTFIAPFSNYGPTDDYRIKPDIAAKGVDVKSLGSGGAGTTALNSGTSMAAPAVTGVFTLWQSYHNEIFQKYMTSASVRALMAHTAKEAGPALGPDFMFGWGLIDADKGRQIMDQANDNTALFREFTLPQKATYEYEFPYDGLEPLVVTIAWNDPAGTASNQTNVNTKKLINDLDVRLINTDNDKIYYPWALEHNINLNVTSNKIAKRDGDNARDNIEKIEPEQAVAGNYKVLISHKNSLSGGSQDYSIIISGAGGQMPPTDGKAEILHEVFNTLKVYPNPVNDILYLQGDFDRLRGSSVAIYDMNGRKIIKNNELFFNNLSEINVGTLSPGTYILSISKNGMKEDYKFIKN